jgi:hypothetical protein
VPRVQAGRRLAQGVSGLLAEACRTHLYTQKTGNTLIASGCLANAEPRGSVIANS